MSYTYNRFKDTTVYGIFKNSNNPNGLDNANATFDGDVKITGTVSGITSAMVGLGNCDNTNDANKPVSTAQQTALNLKANLASPALTGTPTCPTAPINTSNTQLANTAFVIANTGGLVLNSNTWNGINTFNNTVVAGVIQSAGGYVSLDIQSNAGYTPLNIGYNNTLTMNIGNGSCTTDINGTITFKAGITEFNYAPPICNITATATNELTNKSYVDGKVSGLLSSNNTWTGTNAFNTSLPTSILTPSTGTQLITKAFADATYTGIDVRGLNNTWTGTNAFNTSLPTSILTPSTGTQLITKAFADATYTGSLASNNTWTNQNTFSALTIFTGNIQALTFLITPTVLSYIAGLTSNVQTQINSILQAGYALLASPALTGTPTCPTATTGTNTTQLATCEFVLANAGASTPASATFTFYTA